MANLFAITYPDPNRAEQAMKSVEWSNLDHQINVKAACRISKANGEYKVHPSGHPGVGKAAAGGALGLLVGSLFAIPVVGLAAGAAVGLHKGKQKAEKLDDAFVKSIGDQLESGGSAIVVLFEDGADTGRAAVDLAQFGGTVHSSDLEPDRLAHFQAVLDQANQGMQQQPGSDAANA
jgi:uncharacterized membrane protein